MRLQHVEDGDKLFIQTTQGRVAVKPFHPSWWPKQEPKAAVVEAVGGAAPSSPQGPSA